MIKVVIFDSDGVLTNAERFSNQLEKDYGITNAQTSVFFNTVFKDCLLGKANLKEALLPYLKEWNWAGDVESFLTYWFNSEHKVDEELISYIQDLRRKGIKCFVATNQESHRAIYMMEQMGFGKSFDKVYASAHLGVSKPKQAFYSRMMDDFKDINKNEVLFWDDTEANVIGAKEFGINAELYSSFNDFKEKMKSYF